MFQLEKPAATHIPPRSSSPGMVQGRSNGIECSGAGRTGRALIPQLPTEQAEKAGRAVLPSQAAISHSAFVLA